jgi:creatinine amidohydrolase
LIFNERTGMALSKRQQKWSVCNTREIATWAGDPDTVVLIPIGAIEQHGAHLPVDVDIHLAQAVCERATELDSKLLVAPALPFGLSGGHREFAGTIVIGTATYLQLLDDLLSSIVGSGFRAVIVVNGHNGNSAILRQAVVDFGLRVDASVLALTYFDHVTSMFQEHRATAIGGAGHAGEFETSLELFLRPELVGEDPDFQYIDPAIDGMFRDITERGTVARANRLEENYPQGVMGDPRPASAELGKNLFEGAAQYLAEVAGQVRGTRL